MNKNTNIAKAIADELGIAESAVTLSANGKELSVTYKGRTVKIDPTTGTTIEIKEAESEETIPVYNPETLTLQGTPKNTDKYGWKVKNYTVRTNEFTTGVWRLFYQDENYAYLIANECVGSYVPKDQYTGKYTSGEDISTEGKKLNEKVSTIFNDASKKLNPNVLATVWLTDTSTNGPWASYKNSDAVFAIGSPTAELFAASYNNRSNKTSNLINVDLGIYGYTHNTEINWIKTDENYGIYNKNTTSYWWLASPGDERRNGGNSELYLDGFRLFGIRLR